ncbi:DoxX family protein [Fluviicola taffensis]|uniref:DoxX family protein n=1 Tax=Fluviicola taffensis (strain DSM 16823 / NCIMB 13979 / RW262) TaxID=755732 RepID=F2IC82_FLUTR|nr:DoxX family protein [Fluviicola taffensis]AEA44328.1 hypothetical protein Fluta_2342 [Fluviicola taffensis DSM 16823]
MKKTTNVFLWIAQTLLSITLIWAGALKNIQPIEKLELMWPWAGQVSPAFVQFTGVIDLLGGIGLIVPALFRIKPILTPIAALGIILLMISASVFHISRGEGTQIGFNIVVAAIAGFIAYGRLKVVVIRSK